MFSSRSLVMFIWTLLLPGSDIFGLPGDPGAHDPTAIQKCGDTYWIFTTGNGIYAMFSRDLISWTEGRTPFTRSVYPSWINDYVPDFEGHFWAPECIFMNGRFHLYYSCSTWGSKISCIGLVTNETLNPDDPNYLWEDQGVVVYSNNSSDANCIDPSIFRDETGEYYLSYGSYFGGIRIVQIDSLSGKVSGSFHYPVASGNCEASYVIPHEGFYYLFINRGSCCQGVNSTYHIQVGRSENPTGPFLDKEGTDLNSGGGSTILSTYGSFIGPGHVGYYVEDGEEWVTYHYYDGDRNGSPTLAIGTMKWEETGWPEITNDFLDEGEYILVNRNSQLVWQVEGGVADGSAITQGSYVHGAYQKWHLTPVGNGYYSISPIGSDLVAEPENCSAASGTILQLAQNNLAPCEHWRFERSSDLEFLITLRAGSHVVNVPNPVFEEGTQLETSIYSGIVTQFWSVRDTSVSVGYASELAVSNAAISLFPNPSSGGPITITIQGVAGNIVDIEIFTQSGQRIFREYYDTDESVKIKQLFLPGIYLIRMRANREIIHKKFVVL